MTFRFDHDETLVVHADDGVEETADIAPPLHLTSTFVADSAADFAAMATEPRHSGITHLWQPDDYPRGADDRQSGGLRSRILASTGMGAISTTVLALVSAGDHIVAQKNHYMGTSKLLGELLPRLGVTATLVDQTDPAAFAEASPITDADHRRNSGQPYVELTDLASIAELARDRSIIHPGRQHLRLAGQPATARARDQSFRPCRHQVPRRPPRSPWPGWSAVPGNDRADLEHDDCAGSDSQSFQNAWPLLRGIRTLPLRVRQHNESALAVATFGEDILALSRFTTQDVNSHPQHELAPATDVRLWRSAQFRRSKVAMRWPNVQ